MSSHSERLLKILGGSRDAQAAFGVEQSRRLYQVIDALRENAVGPGGLEGPGK